MKTYNLGTTRDTYYKQGNNAMIPNSSCKPTATVEGLSLAAFAEETNRLVIAVPVKYRQAIELEGRPSAFFRKLIEEHFK